jgi:antirestriction protein ArdC
MASGQSWSRQPWQRNAGYIAPWIELLKADKCAFFTVCSQASKAADYLRGLTLAEQTEVAA